MKKKILIANDASYIGSGYGVYGKEILTRLHNSDKFEVAELGCYATVNSPEIKDIPWKFYPNAVSSGDDRLAKYKESGQNQFGAWRFNRVLLDFKPHIVFDVRDYWMSAYQETSPLRKYYHWMIMPTVDSSPQKTEWLYTFCNADLVIPYTKWAKTVLKNSCGSNINLFDEIANAGINTTEFYPIENKIEHKKRMFGGENYSVIGLVMRNQKRKLIPDILIVFKKYLEKIKNNSDLHSKTILYLHTSYPEESGWDLSSLLLEYNLLDKVFFTYSCRQCNASYPSKFHGAITKCPHCGFKASSMTGVSNSIPTNKLNEIYNLFDIFVQYAICEGFGMPQIEAAACGIPIASVDYSAMTEIAENLQGFKIPISRKFRELETNANRVYPDIDATVDILYRYLVETPEEEKIQKSQRTRNLCVEQYTWDKVYSVWEKCFDSIDLSTKKSWDDPNLSATNHQNNIVPNGLNPKEFVNYICENLILEKELTQTSLVQALIRDLTLGMAIRNGVVRSFTHTDVVSQLENYLADKINLENLRVNSKNIVKEDFITCHNPQ
jgi:glycosyltransferase involved in cell wall biosynthesis